MVHGYVPSQGSADFFGAQATFFKEARLMRCEPLLADQSALVRHAQNGTMKAANRLIAGTQLAKFVASRSIGSYL